MALINCPDCNRQVSSAASACPGCGHPIMPGRLAPTTPVAQPPPVAPVVRFRGPPHDCRECGGSLRRETESTGGSSGCIIIILGLLLTPIIIGIFIIIYGIHVSGKRRALWRCKQCEATFPRVLRWYELG